MKVQNFNKIMVWTKSKKTIIKLMLMSNKYIMMSDLLSILGAAHLTISSSLELILPKLSPYLVID